MKILDKGHRYELLSLDGEINQELVFVKRFRGTKNHPGTTIQDVIRCLIDRTETLHNEIPWEGNKEIITHLRKAFVLYEARALCRKVEKEFIKPENIKTDKKDGHFKLDQE